MNNNNTPRSYIGKTFHKKSFSSASMAFDIDLNEEFGTETEADKQMKLMLQKQLNTNISIKDQFSQHRSFTAPSTYTPLTGLVKGECSLENFKKAEFSEELHQELQRCGLTNEELCIYLEFKKGVKKHKKLIDPLVWDERIKVIETKIREHNEALHKPQYFSNVKKLSKHEMDLENTLYAGCNKKLKLSSLITNLTDDDYTQAEIFNHIKDFSNKLEENKKMQKRENINIVNSLNSNSSKKSDFYYDANIHHVTVKLTETEIAKNRLTLEEIQKLPRFENYSIGEPSKILYIKNLHPKISLRELHSLFDNFEDENSQPIEYKICTGRMKGQAFITFTDSKIAENALNFANGYILRNKPIIIQFGKKNVSLK